MTAQVAPPRRPHSWHRRAGLPLRIWLGVLILLGLAHPFLPEARWLLIHVITLGAVTNSILVWGHTLVEKITGITVPDSARRLQLITIAVLNFGIVVTSIGMMIGIPPVTMTGSVIVGGAVCAHLVRLIQLAGAADKNRLSSWFYVLSAACLPVGAGVGAALSAHLPEPWNTRLILAHLAVNLLGFLGLAAAGSLIHLYPAILERTTAVSQTTTARRPDILVALCLGVVFVLAGAVLGSAQLAIAGVMIYLAGWLLLGFFLITELRRTPPRSYAAVSVLAAVGWLIYCLIVLAITLGREGIAEPAVRIVTLPLLVGFAVQLLIGVLSHLLPTLIPGPRAGVLAAVGRMNTLAGWRLVTINLGLVLWLLPVTGWTRVIASSALALAFVVFLPIMASAARLSLANRRGEELAPTPQRDYRLGAVAAVAMLALVPALSGGISGPSGASSTATSAVSYQPSGQTTEVTIDVVGMRYAPETITVPAGDNLILHVRNTDVQIHDLVLANGTETGRINPGETVAIQAGIIGEDVEGWCSIPGHRARGMVFHIVVDGEAATLPAGGADQAASTGEHTGHASAASPLTVDPTASFSEGFQAVDPTAPPVSQSTTHQHTFRIEELELEVAPGVMATRWTFNGQVPGPTLRGKVGDVFEITLINDGSFGHSIDFHAGMVSPDAPMRTINPGEELVYTFTAEHAGVWMYHCGTAPVSMHIAAGMHGAVIIDPAELPEVDAEYVMVQSEIYGTGAPDATTIAATQPDLTVFNGVADQYMAQPLTARTGERIRIYVLAAGPSLSTSFHVVGSQFDTVYAEGAYQLRAGRDAFGVTGGGSQALGLLAAQGGFVEMTFLEAGTYTMVNHQFVDAERGARGQIVVTD